jgi:GTPase SAR1 family protein
MSKYLKQAMQLVPKVTREIAGTKDVDMFGDYRKNYKYKSKFGLLGPVSAGKSSLCAGLVYECQNQSATNPNFYCRVISSDSPILRDANNLRIGKFPEKTDPTIADPPEAALLISKTKLISNSGVFVPVCDVAGEVSDYLNDVSEGYTSAERIRNREGAVNRKVVDTVRDCQGFILTLDANDSILFREHYTSLDSDNYMHNVLTNVFEWRRRNNKPDPHIIIVLTKWDMVMTRAKDLQMDAYDGEHGLQRFLDNGFPALSMLLKPLRDKGMVRFFRSWFNLARDENKQIVYWEGTTKPKIKIIENERSYIRFKPDCSSPDYQELIDHIASFG